MRTYNLKQFYQASGLLLLVVMSTTACNIVSSPGSFDSPLYVANSTSDSITVYAPFTNGDQAPSRFIRGANTLLASPSGVAVNAAGETFIANSSTGSITVYSLGANGNATPIRIISGVLTLLDNPQGAALDAAGNLYVANAGAITSSITVYAPGAGGAPGTPATNVAPIRTISGSGTGLDNPIGVGLDTAGNLYVANAGITTSSITVYAPAANDNVPPSNTITGTSTGLASPQGVVLDPTGRLYVANKTTPSITVYTPGAMGNAIPIRTITGGTTQLSQPLFIALRP